MATHSAEMIGAADSRDIVLIDKKSRSAKRLASDETVQDVLDLIGSSHNVTLTRIAKHRRVLFVEGKDYPLLLKFAKAAEYNELSAGMDLPAISSDGFCNWEKIRDTAWGIRKVLGGAFRMASMLDRDFRSEEEVEFIRKELESEIDLAIILKRKEIENYLLVPAVLCRAINAEVKRKRKVASRTCDETEICGQVMTLTDPLESEIRSQYSACRSEYMRKTGDKRSVATLIKEAADWFDAEWMTLEGRVRVLPGKYVLAKLREWAQKEFAVTLTTSSIMSKMSREYLALDLVEVLEQINAFRAAAVPGITGE
jgi:hypothetical protein